MAWLIMRVTAGVQEYWNEREALWVISKEAGTRYAKRPVVSWQSTGSPCRAIKE